MPILKNAIIGSGLALGTVSYLIIGFGGIALHLWTILIAYYNYGFISAFISFITPIGSEFYWIVKITSMTGNIFNIYNLFIGVYLLAWLTLIIIFNIGEKMGES